MNNITLISTIVLGLIISACTTHKHISSTSPAAAITFQAVPMLPPGTAAPTPVGVMVQMNNGTTQVYPLGIWLEYQNGTIRVIEPTQYVNQPATYQTNGTWTYSATGPNRNVQVWRNGVLQKVGVDYTLSGTATINPIPQQIVDSGTGIVTSVLWNATDIVLVAYLF